MTTQTNATVNRSPAFRRLSGAFGLLGVVVAGLAFPTTTDAADAAPAKAPLAPDRAVASMKVPEGFQVQLFAAEPDVRQPIALTFDTKGRLWVVECFSYPEWELKGAPGRDRVLILEDVDGDGRFDRRKVFLEQGSNLSGIEVGFGGVWLCSTPNLIFVPDRDGDDVPDRAPEIVLDGWDINARHNVFNGLVWGPDGWLWGCNGILSNSKVGAPGSAEKDRTPINCGVWRYHPTRKVFEAVAHGTTNPWGLDFDEYGEAFLTNCVIPHLFHVVPGARFQRMFGEDFNPHTYRQIPTCADHVHWDSVSEQWLDIRKTGVSRTTDKLGGGHAHCGAVFYLGDNWPASYRNSVLMGNIHGNRLNRDRLDRSGSGYVARHEPDFLFANDSWFRSTAQKVGPDGALYVLDWSDTGECHESDADGAHRENGRIYRVTHGPAKRPEGDLAKLDDITLANLQKSPNEWAVRTARRVLQERGAAGKSTTYATALLKPGLGNGGIIKATSAERLRALWALHAIGGLDLATNTALLESDDEHQRSWAVRLLTDDRSRPLDDATLEKLAGMAREESSQKVRLALASLLQRLPEDRRAGIAEGLLARAATTGDVAYSLMVWYGVEPLVAGDLSRAARWALTAKLADVRPLLARRTVAADEAKGLAALTKAMGDYGLAANADSQLDVLAGITEALRGRKALPAPEGWAEAVAALGNAPEATRLADRLAIRFGDAKTLAKLRERAGDANAGVAQRREALEALAEARVPGLASELIAAVKVPALRDQALRSLAFYDDPATPATLLEEYARFSPADRLTAVQTLATRPAWAKALLDAVARQVIPRRDVSVEVARQIQAFRNKDLDEALATSWGTLRATSADTAQGLARYKSLLTPETLKGADLAQGRAVFERTCRQCHKLYGEGGEVGPELTGSDRGNLDYILMNVLDPSASVAAEYRLTNIATTDGRIVAGLLREQTPAALVVQTVNGRVILPRDEVEEVRTTAESMMPAGLLAKMSEDEVRNLVAYLASREQVPAPAASPSTGR